MEAQSCPSKRYDKIKAKSSEYHESKGENPEIISLSKFLKYLPCQLPDLKIEWKILIPCRLSQLISRFPKHFTDMSLDIEKNVKIFEAVV